jgi:hypothetical protein
MSGNLFDRIREKLGFQQYEIECPGVSDQRTGIEIPPHRAKVWAKRQPIEGTYCRNCILTMSLSDSTNSLDPYL